MSKRLQVILDEEEYAEFRKIARNEHLTMAEWVRQALRNAKKQKTSISDRKKLSALDTASACSFPSGDMEQIAAEIEAGYGAQ
jgi:uncharacterized membrane protein